MSGDVSLRIPREEKRELRFKQLAASADRLYALDDEGAVWVLVKRHRIDYMGEWARVGNEPE